MKKILKGRNLIVVLFLTIAIALSAVIRLICIPTQKASAETTDFEERCKQFTDSDYLLNEDGTLSAMKIGAYGEILDKTSVNLEESGYITKVVPEELLLSSQKVIQYMGKEYGFIIIHEGGGFGPNAVVMVIDFNWDDEEDRPKEISTRIEVVVNAFFEYVDLGAGKGYWNTTGNRELVSDTFRLMNVKYMARLENMEEINDGDYGYSMQKDKGMIIQGVRLNYKSVINIDQPFDWMELARLCAKTAFGFIPFADEGKVLGMLDNILNIGEFLVGVEREIVKAGVHTYKFLNTDADIKHIGTKQEQLESGINSHYARTAYLNADGEDVDNQVSGICLPCGGWFDFYLQFDGTESRSRFTRFITFDLVRFDEMGNYEYYTDDDGEKVTCYAADQRIFFDEPQPIDPEVENIIYILPDERSKKIFSVKRSGNYELKFRFGYGFQSKLIDKSTGAAITITERDRYPVHLKAGVEYILETTTLYEHSNSQFTYLNIDFVPFDVDLGDNRIQFNNDSMEYMKIPAGRACKYIFNVTGTVRLTVYDESFNTVVSQYETVQFTAESGKAYYLEINTITPITQLIQLNVSSERTVDLVDWTSTRNYTIRNNEAFSLPAATSKTDYQCEGWYTKPSGQGQLITDENFNDIDAVSVTLYAYYTILPDSQLTKYKITYNLSGGTFTSDQSNAYYTIALTVTFPIPTYEYYDFEGWYTTRDYLGSRVYNTSGKTGDITLYAKWVPKMCVLAFYPNVGTSGSYEKLVKAGETVVLPKETKVHYNGVWTSGGIDYPFGKTIIVKNSMVFTAKWTLTPYTIVYNNMYDKYLNQTAYTSAPKTYTYGTFINFAEYDARFSIAYPASQARCEFKGFYMDKNFKDAATLSSTTSGEFHVYAKWIRLVSNTSRTNTTITDKGIDKNPTNTLTIGLDVYGSYMVQEQKEMGLNLVVIKIELTYHRIDDGYQHVYLYNGSAQLNHWEYSASNTTTRTEYMEVVMNIDDLNNVGALYIKYDASGAWSDDWYIERMSASVQFVNHKDDARPMKNGTIFY